MERCPRCNAKAERGKPYCKRCAYRFVPIKEDSLSKGDIQPTSLGPTTVERDPNEDPKAAYYREKAEVSLQKSAGWKASGNREKAREEMQRAYRFIEDGLKVQPDNMDLKKMKERLMFQIV